MPFGAHAHYAFLALRANIQRGADFSLYLHYLVGFIYTSNDTIVQGWSYHFTYLLTYWGGGGLLLGEGLIAIMACYEDCILFWGQRFPPGLWSLLD